MKNSNGIMYYNDKGEFVACFMYDNSRQISGDVKYVLTEAVSSVMQIGRSEEVILVPGVRVDKWRMKEAREEEQRSMTTKEPQKDEESN